MASAVSAGFLADRLRLFFGMGAALAFAAGVGFVAFGNQDGRGWLDRLIETDPSLSPWSTLILMGGGWLGARYGRLGRTALYSLDAVVSIAVVAAVALNALYGRGVSNGLLVVFFMLATQLFRAVVVPSTGRRTVVIALATGLLSFASVARENFAWQTGRVEVPPALPLVSYGTWILCAVAIAWTASRVIYGLRREVDEAKRLGQYSLLERIGRGGMGQVFRARHAMLRRPTAVKILTRADGDEEALARFEHEVQMTSMLSHPNTVAIYDFGRTNDGVFYYAMEHLEGATLQDVVQRAGPMPVGRVLHVLYGVLSSLVEAHEAGLVHRDVKPGNIFLCRQGGRHDVVKVLDFGLVTDSRAERKEASELILGTPEYLAPEAILEPDRVDARADLYALGCTAYFLLSGRTAFHAETVSEMLRMHIDETPQPLAGLVSSPVDIRVTELVEALMAKRPEDRPQSAQAVLGELAQLRSEYSWSESEASSWWSENADRFPAVSADPRQSGATMSLPPATIQLDPKDLERKSRRDDPSAQS